MEKNEYREEDVDGKFEYLKIRTSHRPTRKELS
jgi:hypothetical protein